MTRSPLTLYSCHCNACQTQSTSGFGMSMPVERDAFDQSGAPLVVHERPAASGRTVRGHFCRRCGTRLFNEPSRNTEIVNIKPGTLDDTSWLRPVGHLWVENAQSWFSPLPDAVTYRRQPDSYEELYQRFRERCGA